MTYRGLSRSARLPRSSSTRADGLCEGRMKAPILAPALAVLACAAVANPVWADGYEFFTVDRGKPVNLVYVGQIRDQQTGMMVREPAYFMVTEKHSGMTFPFVNDRPGHYRSPDIGESVEELAGTPVNPKDLEFSLEIAGYKSVKFTSAPRKSTGIVEVNFAVERDDASASAPGGAARPAGKPAEFTDLSTQAAQDPVDDAGGRSSRFIFMGITAVAIIGGAVARTSGRRRSTDR